MPRPHVYIVIHTFAYIRLKIRCIDKSKMPLPTTTFPPHIENMDIIYNNNYFRES